jgi:hypothetical protein
MVEKRRIRIFGAGVRGAVIADLLRWHYADTYDIDGFSGPWAGGAWTG